MTLTSFDLEGLVRGVFRFFGSESGADAFISFFGGLWTVFTIVSFSLSALMLYLGIYALIRYDQLGQEEQQLLREEEHAYRHAHGEGHEDSKWKNIIEHCESVNPNDWRLAIIEADIMLDGMLQDQGYAGASIGDMLKTADERNFRTLNDAWEAHKVRNRIAHSGTDFVLTKRMAQETLNRYQRVFEEFQVI